MASAGTFQTLKKDSALDARGLDSSNQSPRNVQGLRSEARQAWEGGREGGRPRRRDRPIQSRRPPSACSTKASLTRATKNHLELGNQAPRLCWNLC